MSKRKKHHKRLKQFFPYVRDVADKMNLKHWELILADGAPRDNAIASCFLCSGRNVVTIRFIEYFFERPLEDQRQTVCHELTHCHFAPLSNPSLEVLEGLARAFFVENMEHGIDAIADVVALSMPLPPKID